jgi:2-polyprenyl-3-methyl-5-hydroxy-6-metoxy-1,4-benzoquinol methylase
MKHTTLTHCRICQSTKLETYLDLGKVHLVNKFYPKANKVDKFPLQVNLCRECYNSQLSIVVNPSLMFDEYSYYSSVSKSFSEHCFNLAERVTKGIYPALNEGKRPLSVLDIASNDGCLLKEFKKFGYDILGVDPAANIVNDANIKGIPTCCAYFNTGTAMDIFAKRGKTFDIITAQNVFAHVDDIHDFVLGIEILLAKNGIFIIEFPHILNLLRKQQFDTVYHEHVSYLSLKPVITLMRKCGLEVFHVEEVPTHGGSLRVYVGSVYAPDASVKGVLLKENAMGVYSKATYATYQESVNAFIKKQDDWFKKNKNKNIVGFGASAKGTILLNMLKNQKIKYIIDDTPYKQDKFIPNLNIKVVSREYLKEHPVDYIYVTPWNFKTEINESMKEYKDKLIYPDEL